MDAVTKFVKKDNFQYLKVMNTHDVKTPIFLCKVCEKTPVDALGGYHICPDCVTLNK